jgi:hypothetical protein
MENPVGIAKSSRSACDRCYELKARCQRVSTEASCGRCDRLSLVCSTVRPVRPAGRRLQKRTHLLSSKLPNGFGIVDWLEGVSELRAEERELLIFLLNRPENIDYYVVCPSFQAAAQQALATQLIAGLPTIKEAFLAFANVVRGTDAGLPIDSDNIVRHASAALGELCSLQVSTAQDATLCFTLGAALALSVYSTIGVGLAEICQYSLTAISPFVQEAVPDGHLRSWYGLLVLLETMDSLVHRRKPSARSQNRLSEKVDHHLGLCYSLLPYYYDLCLISHSLANTTDEILLAFLQKQLDTVHESIEAWRPSLTGQIADRFKTAEIVNLFAQAKAYRLGALLVSHRLRHPFGVHDEQADIWSKEIMMELEIAYEITNRPMRCATLPFMIAAVEIRDPGVRNTALQHIERYVDHVSIAVQRAAHNFLCRVWRDRDSQTTLCWLDSVHKPCPVIQSIDITCGN